MKSFKLYSVQNTDKYRQLLKLVSINPAQKEQMLLLWQGRKIKLSSEIKIKESDIRSNSSLDARYDALRLALECKLRG